MDIEAERPCYSGLHLHEEVVFGFPLPLRERDRVRGKGTVTNLFIQAKSAVGSRLVVLPVAFALRTTGATIGYGIAGFTLKQMRGNRRERLFPGSNEPVLGGIVERILQPALALSSAFQRMLAQPHCSLLDAFKRRDDIVIPELCFDFAQIKDAVGRPGL